MKRLYLFIFVSNLFKNIFTIFTFMNFAPFLMFVIGTKDTNEINEEESLTDKEIKSHGVYHKHAISSEVAIASEMGLKMLNMGGNAVDAAVATCLCVGIVNSFSSGLGGGGFMLIKTIGKSENPVMIDFRERAPRNVSLERLMKDSMLSKVGGLAVGIPGEVKGLHYTHAKYGKLRWSYIVEECAKVSDRFIVTEELHKRLKKFESFIKEDEGLSEIYIENDNIVEKGSYISRANLSKTLRIIAESPEDFYSGKIAGFLINSINSKGGVVTEEDFTKYSVKEGKVLTSKFKDYDVYSTGLPSSGVLVLLALNILDKFNLDELIKYKKDGDYTYLHILVEVIKFTMAKRGKLGDFNESFDNLIDELLSDTLAEEIYNKIDKSGTLDIKDYEVEEYNKPDSGTTHINVVDKDGLVVSLTSTINLEFGAKFMDPKTGIILNNQIDDFYIPSIQNSYSVKQTIRNIVSPNKAPLSSSAPIILESKNEMLVLGAAGGIRIPTSIIEVAFFMSLQNTLREAINQPRLHHQLEPNTLYIEKKEKKEVIDFFKSRKHNVKISTTNTAFTSVQGILVKILNDNSKIIDAVSDYRKNVSPAGE